MRYIRTFHYYYYYKRGHQIWTFISGPTSPVLSYIPRYTPNKHINTWKKMLTSCRRGCTSHEISLKSSYRSLPIIVVKAYNILPFGFSFIFCAGGYDGQDFLSSVECYDPCTDTWTVVTNMCSGRSGAGVAVGMEPCRTGMCGGGGGGGNTNRWQQLTSIVPPELTSLKPWTYYSNRSMLKLTLRGLASGYQSRQWILGGVSSILLELTTLSADKFLRLWLAEEGQDRLSPWYESMKSCFVGENLQQKVSWNGPLVTIPDSRLWC